MLTHQRPGPQRGAAVLDRSNGRLAHPDPSRTRPIVAPDRIAGVGEQLVRVGLAHQRAALVVPQIGQTGTDGGADA